MRKKRVANAKKPKHFILDVDGVLTDGRFYYTTEGKAMKAFGPDDHDALLLLKPHINIHIVTGDRKGFAITKKRVVDDMKFKLDLVSTVERLKWMKDNGYAPQESIYMGDGIFDALAFSEVAYAIAPANAFYVTKQYANFVTKAAGGDSAVAEACVHILKKFFTPFDPLKVVLEKTSGEWGTATKEAL